MGGGALHVAHDQAVSGGATGGAFGGPPAAYMPLKHWRVACGSVGSSVGFSTSRRVELFGCDGCRVEIGAGIPLGGTRPETGAGSRRHSSLHVMAQSGAARRTAWRAHSAEWTALPKRLVSGGLARNRPGLPRARRLRRAASRPMALPRRALWIRRSLDRGSPNDAAPSWGAPPMYLTPAGHAVTQRNVRR